jgi:hypothetical protein
MGEGSLLPLFAGRPLREELACATRIAVDMFLNSRAEELMSSTEADFLEPIVHLATFRIPVVHRGDAYLEPPADITAARLGADRAVAGARVTRFTLAVPVTGQLSLLTMKVSDVASPASLSGEIDEIAGLLRLYCDGVLDPVQVKTGFEKQLDQIEELLARMRAELESHNRLMTRELTAAVHQRRGELLAAQEMQAGIGYEVRRRPDADMYTIPVSRTRLAPGPSAAARGPAKPYVPEPALADADYEAALAVLWNARNALERSRSMSAKLDEQEIRDLLLVMLNAQFEGKAGGEVFNCSGKTDILIREGDRNVFIGECKIYDPKNKQSVDKVVTDALTQLLSYLAWRDTKAALLLFIRDTDVSGTVSKALTAVPRHPSYLRHGTTRTEERHDFVMHAVGDETREIYLALLPFLIASRNRKQNSAL